MPRLTNYLKTLFVCLGIFFTGVFLHYELVLACLIILAIVGFAIRLIKFWPHINWPKLATQFLLVTLAFTVAELTFNYQTKQRHQVADAIAKKIIAHKTKHGAFPHTLAEIGEENNAKTHQIKYFYFKLHPEAPILEYRDVALTPGYNFNFHRNKWVDTS